MINWIKTKWKIWRYHRKHGYFKRSILSQKEYENFYVEEKDMRLIKRMNCSNVVLETEDSISGVRVIGFPFKTKKD